MSWLPSPEVGLFWVFAVATVIAAVGVIVAKNPIGSAMSLVATFFFLSGIYVLLWAHTIAALQVLVYAGAIMVLFLFVIMLLSLQDSGPTMQFSFTRVLGAAGVAGLLAALVVAFRKLPQGDVSWVNEGGRLQSFGTIQKVGEVMYTQWLFPFEAVSLLLLVAIVGAVVVAKPRI
jgi:NADH-quinone oxidoreductase subunit J